MKNLYESIEEITKMYKAYAKILSKAEHRTRHGLELKILTLKWMLQWLPIALFTRKNSNNSENLLNEIRQIVYLLYQSNEITKKSHNSIIKWIQIKV